MGKKKESSGSSAIFSRWQTILWTAVIFGVGYFAGINHAKISEVYVETEPQRKEVGLKTVEFAKFAWDKTFTGIQKAFKFLSDKAGDLKTEKEKADLQPVHIKHASGDVVKKADKEAASKELPSETKKP